MLPSGRGLKIAPALPLVMVSVFWTYSGWQEAAYVVSEIKDRRRNIPRALLLGTAAVIVIYLVVNAAYLYGLGFDAFHGPGGRLFAAHLTAMSELTAQIAELRDLNEKYLRNAIRSSQETLAGPRDDAGLYNASGTAGGTATGARLFDQSV